MHMSLPRFFARHHGPAWALVLASAFWGMGFSWAKNAGEAVCRAAGRPETATVGPVTVLAIRFTVATLIWLSLVPAARRGWSWRTLRNGLSVGGMLCLGLILQHIGLGASDEAVIAFLTNLTVVFVPAYVLLANRRRPKTGVLIAVPVALLGMALLVGVGGPVRSAGAGWGVACAAALAAALLLLDRFGRGESSAKMTLLLFASAAVTCLIAAPLLPGFGDIEWRTLARSDFLTDIVLLTGLTTIAAFALMTAFQPKVDATRAAVLYLCEPLFAAAFAWVYNGRSMSASAVAGAVLILSANVIAEWRPRRKPEIRNQKSESNPKPE